MSTILDLGIPGVGSGILQPRQKNRFRLTFANMGGGVDSQPVSMQVVQASRPKITYEKIELHRYTGKAMIAGKYSFDPMNIVLQDDVRGTATTVLQAQQQKQQWLIGAEGQWLGAAGEASLFKFVAYLDMLDGKQQVTETWTMEGCWLEAVDYGEMTYDSADPVTITLTMSFDMARQSIGGYDQGQGLATGGVGS
jgi:hypothetical protein